MPVCAIRPAAVHSQVVKTLVNFQTIAIVGSAEGIGVNGRMKTFYRNGVPPPKAPKAAVFNRRGEQSLCLPGEDPGLFRGNVSRSGGGRERAGRLMRPCGCCARLARRATSTSTGSFRPFRSQRCAMGAS